MQVTPGSAAPVAPAAQTGGTPHVAPPAAAGAAGAPASEKPVSGEAPKPGSPDQDPRFASKFAALARKDKALTTREAALKAELAQVSEYKKDMELKAKDPYAWAEKHGITYSGYTERVLKGKPSDTEAKVKEIQDKIAAAEKAAAEKAAAEKAAAERAKSDEYTAKETAFRGKIKEFVGSNAEKYEVTAARDPEGELVYALMEEHYDRTCEKDAQGNEVAPGKVLTFEEACEIAEAHYEAEALAEYERLQALNKVKSRFKAPETAPPGQKGAESGAKPSQESPRTLSNLHQSEVPAPDDRPLTDDERLRKAAAMIRITRS